MYNMIEDQKVFTIRSKPLTTDESVMVNMESNAERQEDIGQDEDIAHTVEGDDGAEAVTETPRVCLFP